MASVTHKSVKRPRDKRIRISGQSFQETLIHKHYSGANSLCVSHPELVKQWHPSKNGPLKPDYFTYGSNKKIWWRCSKGPDHNWQASIKNRAKKDKPAGCPCCTGRKVSVTNSLKSKFPEVAREWHHEKNKPLSPSSVLAFSSRKVWWRCRNYSSHEWQANIEHRTGKASGCPFCKGKRASSDRNLKKYYPKIAAQWHKTNNGNLKPEQFTPKSRARVWWQCLQHSDHKWQTSIVNRTSQGTGCPYCKRKKACSTNSLATLYPDIAKQWHQKKNSPQRPDDVTPGSHHYAWWQCKKSDQHVWKATIEARTGQKSGCPFCSGHKVAQDTCLATKYPALAKQWHPTRNLPLMPSDVTPGSSKRVWWLCQNSSSHEWSTKVQDRTNSTTGCPFCTGCKASSEHNLRKAYPEIAAQWHKINNGTLRPEEFTPKSSKRVWWKCVKYPDHTWQVSIASRTSQGNGCPYCRGLKVCTSNSLAKLYPDIAKEWHPKKNFRKRPNDVTPGSHHYAWWQCKISEQHVWEATITSRTGRKSGCPFCAGRRVAQDNCLATKYPALAKQWHPTRNLPLMPSKVTPGSNKRVWWRCFKSAGHIWSAKINDVVIVRKKGKTGCPFCAGNAKEKN